MIIKGLFLLTLIATVASTVSAAPLDLSRAKIVLPGPQRKIMANAAAMLRDEVEKRTRITLGLSNRLPESDDIVILIGTAAELAAQSYRPDKSCQVPAGPDAYSIWIDTSRRRAPTICLAGRDDRGTLFAVGRLLRLLSMGRDQLQLERDPRLATAPAFALRGDQFGYRPKTHAYDAWTLAMWEQYYRDMIVFGMNAVELIPPRSDDDADSPHFPKPPMEMMVAMSQLADDYGLDVWIWYPALNADYSDARTVELALAERDEVFKKLPRIDAVFVPGGDPGETRPDILLKFVEKTKVVLNKSHPKAQIWVSPQGFDRPGENRQGWLKMFLDILKTQQPPWLDGVVFGPQVETTLANLRAEVPARYPIRQYPDITHTLRCQYPVADWDEAYRRTEAREIINPRPEAYAKIFQDDLPYSAGTITYSEGCNDDFNMVLWNCLSWNPRMTTAEIANEYSRYFIGDRDAAIWSEGLFDLEKNWEGPLLTNQQVDKTLELFRALEMRATPQEKLNWRFQQGLYRACYDAYIRRRLIYERDLQLQAMDALRKAGQTGSLAAMKQAQDTLDLALTRPVAADLRARVFELAEALFQSIRMQLSVPRYQAINVNRGANLDTIDVPLNDRVKLEGRFDEIRKLPDEKDRLETIARIMNETDSLR
jgi:hypothetical protein